jgi:hypothetical protein
MSIAGLRFWLKISCADASLSQVRPCSIIILIEKACAVAGPI